MAILFIKELGQVTVKETKEEILMELQTENPSWAEYTVEDSYLGERVVTIRTSYIISIE